jgi:hypothetical protein
MDRLPVATVTYDLFLKCLVIVVRRGSGISFGERGGATNLSNGSTGPNSLAAMRRQHRSDAWAAKEEASRPGGITRIDDSLQGLKN